MPLLGESPARRHGQADIKKWNARASYQQHKQYTLSNRQYGIAPESSKQPSKQPASQPTSQPPNHQRRANHQAQRGRRWPTSDGRVFHALQRRHFIKRSNFQIGNVSKLARYFILVRTKKTTCKCHAYEPRKERIEHFYRC